MSKVKVAIVVSHPVQHFCPQYASFAKHPQIVLKVFFASTLGFREYADKQFGQGVMWKNLYLDEFDHEFLNGDKVLPSDQNLDAPSLNDALENFQPQLLISYGYFQKLQRRATRWAQNNQLKIAYISDGELRHPRPVWKEMLKYVYVNRYFSKLDFFLTVGDANETYYRYYGVPAAKMIRMHFPIDVRNYEDSFNQKDILRSLIRKRYNVDEQALVLAVVGKLAPWKRQGDIIKALHALEEQGTFATLFIIGSGVMREQWERSARHLKNSKVIFTGFVPADELPAYYAACDIYVHPAFREPHSLAISEAVFMGCPAIISDASGSYGQHDDVQQGVTGFVFPYGDTAALARAIQALVNDATKRRLMGEEARRRACIFQQNSHHSVLDVLISRLN